MQIKNISKRSFIHTIIDEKGNQIFVTINSGETKDIPDKIAKLWLKTGEVVGVDDGSKDKEIERLKAENEKLKNVQNEEKKQALINKCKEYGIKIGNPKTAKIETLEKKIAEYEAMSSAE